MAWRWGLRLGESERDGSGGREDVLPYIEIEKGTLGRFGLLSGSMGIFGVTSMSKKNPKMFPQCRRPILKMFPQCRKRSDVSAEKNGK